VNAQAGPTSPASTGLDRLLLVLVGGFVGIIGSVVAQQYQARYAREQFAIQLRFKEQEDAAGALKEIGAMADAPIARARSVIEAVLDKRPDSTVRRLKTRFDEAAETWHLGYNHARVLASVYFKDTVFLNEVDSMVAYASRELPPAGRRNAVDVAHFRSVADSARRKGSRAASQLDSIANELVRTGNELARLDRKTAEVLRDKVRNDQEWLFTHQMIWAWLISTRQAGSFDPLARYTLTPLEEAHAQDSLRKLIALDSIAALKANARPDSR